MGGVAPKKLERVPDGRPVLDTSGHQDLPLAESFRRTFTQEESLAYRTILEARSLGELRSAIDSFNGVSTPKKASELNMSLADMEISDQPISVGDVHDLPTDVRVILSRDKYGVANIRLVETH